MSERESMRERGSERESESVRQSQTEREKEREKEIECLCVCVRRKAPASLLKRSDHVLNTLYRIVFVFECVFVSMGWLRLVGSLKL